MSVNVLLSFAFWGHKSLAEVRRELVCGKLMIDSGAFTAWSIGQQIDLAEYAEYLHTWQGHWDHAVTLDTIGDPVATRKSTRALHEQGLPVMPVFTRGESVAEFDAMVRDCGYVCVGGGVGMSQQVQIRRAKLLQRRASDLGGGIHALGIGAVSLVREAMPYSADSSNISNAFRYGTIRYFDGRDIRSCKVSDKAYLLKHWEQLRGHDINVADLAQNGRMPKGQIQSQLMQAMSLAYASADEWLHSVGRVSVPRGVPDPRPGPHLYSSITGDHLLPGVINLDHRLHQGYMPPVWRKYGRNHLCVERKAA
jgi:hypothetical protein